MVKRCVRGIEKDTKVEEDLEVTDGMIEIRNV